MGPYLFFFRAFGRSDETGKEVSRGGNRLRIGEHDVILFYDEGEPRENKARKKCQAEQFELQPGA